VENRGAEEEDEDEGNIHWLIDKEIEEKGRKLSGETYCHRRSC